jgi:hypothetical protein
MLVGCTAAAPSAPVGVGGHSGAPSASSGAPATSGGALNQAGAAGAATGAGAGAGAAADAGTAGQSAGAPGGGSGGALSGSGGAGGTAGNAGGGSVAFPSDPKPISLADDAGYCWFEGSRALWVGDKLIVGSVASGWSVAARKGDIEAIVYDAATSKSSVVELHDRLELDDHDSAGFVVRPDGKLLALYAKHGTEDHFYFRVSNSASLLDWSAEKTFAPTAATLLTYSNLFLLPAENNRIYDFYRGLDNSYKPSFAYSDDSGQTWHSGNIVINVPSTQKHRPYVRYATNGTDTVHLVYTEAHPRDFDNSLYHVSYRQGMLYKTDGSALHPLSQGLTSPDEGSRIYQGNADNVAWGMDVTLDAQGRPAVLYSVQVGSAGLPTGQGGDDIRYRYARWDGAAWRDFALAFGGRRLYAGEDDYSGLGSFDPTDPSVVFISTNANPTTGAPLISATDNARHHEIFRGVTADGGQTWQWTPVTHDSTLDNLRPLLPPPGPNGRRALLWLRGTYRAYTDYQQELLAVLW